MSLVLGVSRPSVQSLPDSPFSENIAKPSERNIACCGVNGFGSDSSDKSGAIDTKTKKSAENLKLRHMFKEKNLNILLHTAIFFIQSLGTVDFTIASS